MSDIAAIINDSHISTVSDFICPYVESRALFKPTIVFYIDRPLAPTLYQDTKAIFEAPSIEEAKMLNYELIHVTQLNWSLSVEYAKKCLRIVN